MTKKRYTYGEHKRGIAFADEVEHEYYCWFNEWDCRETVDMLNEYEEQIKELEKENRILMEQKKLLINNMDIWCPTWFYYGIIDGMKECELLDGDVE